LSQDPFYVVKTHAIYTFRPGFWLGLGVGYGEGGRTNINGVKRDTYQRNWRFGSVLSYPIDKHHGLSFVYTTGIRNGRGGDFDSFALAYQLCVGRGLNLKAFYRDRIQCFMIVINLCKKNRRNNFEKIK
jgi:hypothetical protein